MMGEQPDEVELFPSTDIEWHMFGYPDTNEKEHWVSADSKTGIFWTAPVDTAFVAEHFDEMFDMNIRNVSYRELKVPAQLLDYEFTWMNSTHMNLTLTFFEPYMLGLLVKKSDRLYIKMKHDILHTDGRFVPEKAYLNAMFLDQATDREGQILTTIWADECIKDAETDAAQAGDGGGGRRLQAKSKDKFEARR
jgi:hypothetical protein